MEIPQLIECISCHQFMRSFFDRFFKRCSPELQTKYCEKTIHIASGAGQLRHFKPVEINIGVL